MLENEYFVVVKIHTLAKNCVCDLIRVSEQFLSTSGTLKTKKNIFLFLISSCKKFFYYSRIQFSRHSKGDRKKVTNMPNDE